MSQLAYSHLDIAFVQGLKQLPLDLKFFTALHALDVSRNELHSLDGIRVLLKTLEELNIRCVTA